MSGTFVISKRSNGDFQFNLKAGNGQVVLARQGCSDRGRRDQWRGVGRENSADDGRFERKVSSNAKQFFKLLAANGQVIGTSELHESEAAREHGIKSVKTHAPDAALVHETA